MASSAPDRLYKVLGEGRVSMHGGSGKWTPGRWRAVRGPLTPCRNGLHLCRPGNLLTWLGPEIWLAEHDGERIDQDDNIVVRRARITERLETWNDRTARLFTCDCAERVLPLFEKRYPSDPRPRQAIEVARRYGAREATAGELAAARAAAGAAGVAARDAAGAAWAAAWDAAGAAWAAAWAASAAGAAWAGRLGRRRGRLGRRLGRRGRRRGHRARMADRAADAVLARGG